MVGKVRLNDLGTCYLVYICEFYFNEVRLYFGLENRLWCSKFKKV